ncbi:MAG: XRE family transcriptional regulator [Pirellulaceae bacterium]|jgi:transcriptional regulator with XRE-family HTH domain|nr:XRE family transcriptional regulator [Pirellulaceae bacterium]
MAKRRAASAPKGKAAPAAERAAHELAAHVCQRIRALRAERGWSLDQLAAASGVSRSMLSQIERERANPTLAVTMRIAQAFEMSLGDLVEAPQSGHSIEVMRGSDAQFMYRSDDACQIRTLSPLRLEKDVEFYELRLRGGGQLRSAPHFEGTREFLTVERGRVEVNSGDAQVALGKGDSASYRADLPHAVANVGRAEAVLYLVVIYA